MHNSFRSTNTRRTVFNLTMMGLIVFSLLARPGGQGVFAQAEETPAAEGEAGMKKGLGFERYVTKTGTDGGGNDCTNSGNPCRTIAYAVSQCSSYDTLHIGAGTFTAFNIIINFDLTIIGEGMQKTTLDGIYSDRVIKISPKSIVVIKDLTIQNGYTKYWGGGIYSAGKLKLIRVRINNNSAKSAGGIYAKYKLTMKDVEVSDNSAYQAGAGGTGGGIFLDTYKQVRLTNVTINNNSATGLSGGVHSQGNGNYTFTNVTISGNTAKNASALTNTGSTTTTLFILNSTITNNKCLAGGTVGGVQNYSNLSFKNTIISANDGANCFNASILSSVGHNIDSGTTCNFAQPGDQQNTNPLIGSLADNGGYTQTHALLVGSPAIDGGTNTGCPAEDQRGINRPKDGDGNSTVVCDIGAYEYTPAQEAGFRSIDTYDGWVLEKDETSGKGGALDDIKTTFIVGDDNVNRQYRGFLHFDTSTLPDNAIITKVQLKVRKKSITGTDPFTTHGKILLDIQTGAFNGNNALELKDFQLPATQGVAGSIRNNPLKDWCRTSLKAARFQYINLTGPTQFRLRFKKDDDNDNDADYFSFVSGNKSIATLRPRLTVTYYVP